MADGIAKRKSVKRHLPRAAIISIDIIQKRLNFREDTAADFKAKDLKFGGEYRLGPTPGIAKSAHLGIHLVFHTGTPESQNISLNPNILLDAHTIVYHR